MKCNQHPEKEAIAVCVSCHKPICKQCKVKIEGRNFCKACAREVINKEGAKSIDLGEEFKQLTNVPYDLVDKAQDATGKVKELLKEKGVDTEINNIKSNIKSSVRETSETIEESTKNFNGFNVPFKNPLEEIMKAKELLDAKAISKEEFENIKKRYMDML